MNALLRDEGTVTLETTLAIAVLVPVLFAILQFGGAFQRWIAQDAVAVQGARHAAEVGGDAPEVRRAIDTSLRASGLDPATVSVAIEPATVGWREPIQVRLGSDARIAIPFLFTATLPLRSTAVARGEVAR
ncbi:MAG: hypothetical protein ACR2G8_05650 [Candidatus Limnocylindria bacterium]|nr:pilus assembly protein [Chloroflexota bacterium]MDQ3401188.1 pilus assembly protein [Chloroflexota bacterium]